ncbi:MAG: Ig-like domain-containing protein [Bacteroidia bacterium]|nr:Ig-like domain-containing protein [Bacteroidia bacterium]
MLIATSAFSATVTITPTGADDTNRIQMAINSLNPGDKLVLNGDFVHNKTIYLQSNMIWELRGTLTLAKNSAANLDKYGEIRAGFNNSRSTGIASPIGMKNVEFFGGTIYGNGDFNGKAIGLPSVRLVNMVFAEDCYFNDFTVEDSSDDCFTLGSVSHHNTVERVIGRHAGGSVSKIGGNALTDVGNNNTWIDCVADQGGSDGWTPKCRNSTFIRCIASNNTGPGFGMYAREEGYADNRDVGAIISGNRFIDCVAYGSKNSAGFSFDISSNCPGGIIKDNFIQAVCYDNNGSGVSFRNKDDAEAGIIKDNVVDLVCYGNKCLTQSGNPSTWDGGLGMENDNSTLHNLVENCSGSVVCYDNIGSDVNTRGGTNCNLKVYSPADKSTPIVANKSTGNNTVAVINYSCSDQLTAWCQKNYCGVESPATPVTGVTLTPATATIAAGNTQQLSQLVTPMTAINQRAVFTSNNTSVATVNRSGLVSAVAEGSAIITATTEDGGKQATSQITVTKAATASDYLDNCDAIIGWNATATINTSDKKQGSGCLENLGSNSTEFSKVFIPSFNSGATPENGELKFWYWVSLAELGTRAVRVEIGSAGKSDVDEYQWTMAGLTEGWNQITLNTTNASKIGNPDLSVLNWFRIYSSGKVVGVNVKTRVDAIELASNFLSVIKTTNTDVKSVNIYPNPRTKSTLSMELVGFQDVRNVQVKIVNLLGQTVYQKNADSATTIEINTSGMLKDSIFFFVVEVEESKIPHKLIVKYVK